MPAGPEMWLADEGLLAFRQPARTHGWPRHGRPCCRGTSREPGERAGWPRSFTTVAGISPDQLVSGGNPAAEQNNHYGAALKSELVARETPIPTGRGTVAQPVSRARTPLKCSTTHTGPPKALWSALYS